ncbi:MAG: DUF4355 domain-containing protein [Acidimicrobiia bacterium]|nr:DUF4355 domain-containing protein [Acidimicrobiia bacterium]
MLRIIDLEANAEATERAAGGGGDGGGARRSPTTRASGDGGQAQTFTQEHVDRIVKERLARERAKYEDYDDLKKKAEQYDQLQDEQKSELERERAAREKAEAEAEKARQQRAGDDHPLGYHRRGRPQRPRAQGRRPGRSARAPDRDRQRPARARRGRQPEGHREGDGFTPREAALPGRFAGEADARELAARRIRAPEGALSRPTSRSSTTPGRSGRPSGNSANPRSERWRTPSSRRT